MEKGKAEAVAVRFLIVYSSDFCYHLVRMNEEKSQIPSQMNLPKDRLIAAIGYIGVLCVVPLLFNKDSEFATYHGKQGLVLLIAWFGLWIANAIPVFGQIIWGLGSILLFVLMVIGVVNALSGKKSDLPVIGRYTKKIKIRPVAK